MMDAHSFAARTARIEDLAERRGWAPVVSRQAAGPTTSSSDDDVLLVAAAAAYPYYHLNSAYVTGVGRGYVYGRDSRWMAFYYRKGIQREVPEILHRWDEVPME